MDKQNSGQPQGKKPLPIWAVIPLDAVLIAANLLTFAYFHHVKPKPVDTAGTPAVTAFIPGLTTGGTTTETTAAGTTQNNPEAETTDLSKASGTVTETGSNTTASDGTQTGTSAESSAAQTDAQGNTVSSPQSTAGSDAVKTTAPSTSAATSTTVTTTVVTDPRDYIDWGSGFSAQFSAGNEIYKTENSYRSHDVCVNLSAVQYLTSVAHVADIYVRYSGNFKGAYALNKDGQYGRNIYEDGESIMQRNNAIIGVNADLMATRDTGMIIRNWELFREEPLRDVGCLYYDGTFQTIAKNSFSMAEALASGVYQTMTFAPALVQNGQAAPTWYGSVATTPNPRAGFGYYEPGHYVFVVVDGRQPGYSDGLTATEFTQFFLDLGVTEAFNLDGGDSARMYFDGQLVSAPSGSRQLSDVFLIREVP